MKRVLIILLMMLSVGVVFADKSKSPTSQRSIKQEQQRTKKEINETARKIDSNKKKTRTQLNLLNKLTAEISKNTQELNNLKISIASIDTSIVKLNDSINVLEKKLTVLRENYKDVLRSVRASRHSTSRLAFLFSSKSFADAYRRMRYLQQFSSWQNKKDEEIKSAISAINEVKNGLTKLQTERTESLKKVMVTQQSLIQNEAQQSQVVADLKKERSSLEAYMKEKQKEAKQLDDQLNKLIAKQQAEEKRRREEAEKKRKEEERRKKEQEKALAEQRKKEAEQNKEKTQSPTQSKPQESKEDLAMNQPAKPTVDVETEAQNVLSGKFEENKGRLPFPVSGNYSIVGKFGRHKHPQLQYVEINNNGIDIELLSNDDVRAVFDGVVSAIFQQPGFNTIVMVRHGEYITVYGNISTLSVRPGDKVKAKQKLGDVYADPDDDNRRILHFELRKETQKLNPQHWLK